MNSHRIITIAVGGLALASLSMCSNVESQDLKPRPATDLPMSSAPAGGESAPIGGRADLPPEQPRR